MLLMLMFNGNKSYYVVNYVIVNKAEWLGSAANIKGANNDAKI